MERRICLGIDWAFLDAVTAANCFRIDHAKVYFIDWPRPCQVHLTPHQEGLHYLEDISAGKLLVLEHGRREGVDGGPDVVVEKEDVKTSVGVRYLMTSIILLTAGAQHARGHSELRIPCSSADIQVKRLWSGL